MSQSPKPLRPKARRALNWDPKPPEKPRRVHRWAAGLGARLSAWRRSPVLRQAGLAEEHIDTLPLCTACHPELYWSHRKMGDQRGNHAAMIALEG